MLHIAREMSSWLHRSLPRPARGIICTKVLAFRGSICHWTIRLRLSKLPNSFGKVFLSLKHLKSLVKSWSGAIKS